MSSRQRGALWFVVLCLGGRLLDLFDLPFEARPPSAPPPDTLAVTATMGDTVAAPSGAGEPGAVADTGTTPATNTAAARTPEPIAINRASAEELQRLPRVGPVLAARIVAYRREHGSFRAAADLQGVPGIGPRTAARLAPLLRFD